MFRLELAGICKQYPSVKANDEVSLRVRPGAIHAILGENGAGKSTLLKIVYGAVKPDSGSILWNGAPVLIQSPAAARAMGIRMVYQHFSLFDRLTVAQNVWLGQDRQVSLQSIVHRIQTVAETYGLPIDPLRPIHALSVGERQRVEIIRALMTEPQLLILDEPTSVLTPQAIDKLFVTLRELAQRGCSILYVSHKLDEIRALCEQCTVLRNGRVTGEVDPRLETAGSLSRLMIGADPGRATRRPPKQGHEMLTVRALSLAAHDTHGVTLKAIGLSVHKGEILGIAGVSGNGQQALVSALSGEDPRVPPRTIWFDGEDLANHSPSNRRRKGLRTVPEQRLGHGAVPSLSLAQNTLLTRTEGVSQTRLISSRALRKLAQSIIERFQVKATGPTATAQSLSGGNLQKFIVGREISAEPRALIVSQPTWGVDVGAAALIRAELLRLRDAGCAILVVSEDLEELLEISDRMMVMAQGRLSPAVRAAELTVEQIGQWMSGLWGEAEHAAA